MKMNNHETWKSFINFETKKPYFKEIKDHLISDNAEGKIVLPEPKKFFRAFDLCELNKVKVVIKVKTHTTHRVFQMDLHFL